MTYFRSLEKNKNEISKLTFDVVPSTCVLPPTMRTWHKFLFPLAVFVFNLVHKFASFSSQLHNRLYFFSPVRCPAPLLPTTEFIMFAFLLCNGIDVRMRNSNSWWNFMRALGFLFRSWSCSFIFFSTCKGRISYFHLFTILQFACSSSIIYLLSYRVDGSPKAAQMHNNISFPFVFVHFTQIGVCCVAVWELHCSTTAMISVAKHNNWKWMLNCSGVVWVERQVVCSYTTFVVAH